jgi:hypothetical protein
MATKAKGQPHQGGAGLGEVIPMPPGLRSRRAPWIEPTLQQILALKPGDVYAVSIDALGLTANYARTAVRSAGDTLHGVKVETSTRDGQMLFWIEPAKKDTREKEDSSS